MKRFTLSIALLCSTTLLLAEEQHFDQIVADHHNGRLVHPKTTGVALPNGQFFGFYSIIIENYTPTLNAHIDLCEKKNNELHVRYRIVIRETYCAIESFRNGTMKEDRREYYSENSTITDKKQHFTLYCGFSLMGCGNCLDSLELALYQGKQTRETIAPYSEEAAPLLDQYYYNVGRAGFRYLVFSSGDSKVIYQDCPLSNW